MVRDIQFLRVTKTLKWPRNVRSLLLQSVFKGKAQDSYTSLSSELSQDYDVVKTTVLRADELVPEAYRQKFCHLKKTYGQTYWEFGHEKEALFERWCCFKGVDDFEIFCYCAVRGF